MWHSWDQEIHVSLADLGHCSCLSCSIRFLQTNLVLFLQNTPNDLQMLSDAPAHHIFVLLGPVNPDQTSLPEVLCVLQV